MYILTKGGKPAVALINIDHLERMINEGANLASRHSESPRPSEAIRPPQQPVSQPANLPVKPIWPKVSPSDPAAPSVNTAPFKPNLPPVTLPPAPAVVPPTPFRPTINPTWTGQPVTPQPVTPIISPRANGPHISPNASTQPTPPWPIREAALKQTVASSDNQPLPKPPVNPAQPTPPLASAPPARPAENLPSPSNSPIQPPPASPLAASAPATSPINGSILNPASPAIINPNRLPATPPPLPTVSQPGNFGSPQPTPPLTSAAPARPTENLPPPPTVSAVAPFSQSGNQPVSQPAPSPVSPPPSFPAQVPATPPVQPAAIINFDSPPKTAPDPELDSLEPRKPSDSGTPPTKTDGPNDAGEPSAAAPKTPVGDLEI